MKKLLVILVLCFMFSGNAQAYRGEIWDYLKVGMSKKNFKRAVDGGPSYGNTAQTGGKSVNYNKSKEITQLRKEHGMINVKRIFSPSAYNQYFPKSKMEIITHTYRKGREYIKPNNQWWKKAPENFIYYVFENVEEPKDCDKGSANPFAFCKGTIGDGTLKTVVFSKEKALAIANPEYVKKIKKEKKVVVNKKSLDKEKTVIWVVLMNSPEHYNTMSGIEKSLIKKGTGDQLEAFNKAAAQALVKCKNQSSSSSGYKKKISKCNVKSIRYKEMDNSSKEQLLSLRDYPRYSKRDGKGLDVDKIRKVVQWDGINIKHIFTEAKPKEKIPKKKEPKKVVKKQIQPRTYFDKKTLVFPGDSFNINRCFIKSKKGATTSSFDFKVDLENKKILRIFTGSLAFFNKENVSQQISSINTNTGIISSTRLPFNNLVSPNLRQTSPNHYQNNTNIILRLYVKAGYKRGQFEIYPNLGMSSKARKNVYKYFKNHTPTLRKSFTENTKVGFMKFDCGSVDNIYESQARLDAKKNRSKTVVNKPKPESKKTKPSSVQLNDSKLLAASSGTGFFVTKDGHMVTNHHVIEGCDAVKVNIKGKEIPADIISVDRINDLAIIKANIRPSTIFAVSNEDVSLLQDIIVAGYPLGKKVSAAIKTHKGSVTALAGFGDNYSNFQTDATINQGNSGGPIITQAGNVIGVAVQLIDPTKAQNIFFGVKSSTLKTFANANNINFLAPNFRDMSNKDLGSLVTEGTVFLECWMSVAKIKRMIAEEKNRKAFYSEHK
jgi:S1-C subfamily serine protease